MSDYVGGGTSDGKDMFDGIEMKGTKTLLSPVHDKLRDPLWQGDGLLRDDWEVLAKAS